MIEKVNPSHPDKVADRIAGAIVDLAYTKQDNPKIAVEVLIGHGKCHIIAETSVKLGVDQVVNAAQRITPLENLAIDYKEVPQDPELAKNQAEEIRCGDNGIFKGMPTNKEESMLTGLVRDLYKEMPTDGKFIYDQKTDTLIACQSNATNRQILEEISEATRGWDEAIDRLIVNPLGEWTGGTNVDTGATNRKLGSDMGRAITGGGLHGKDLSKADVSVNIACHILAQKYQAEVQALCAIGDNSLTFEITGHGKTIISYSEVVEMARDYINNLGGFEKLAEWGLI